MYGLFYVGFDAPPKREEYSKPHNSTSKETENRSSAVATSHNAHHSGSATEVSSHGDTVHISDEARKKASESHPSFWSVAENFAGGMVDGVKNTVGDLIHTVEHPVQTVKALGEAVSHPVRTYEAIKQAASDAIQKFKNEDANGKAHDIGDALAQVALAAVGTKGATALAKGVSKGAEAGEIISKVNPELAASEIKGGHTIANHAGKTDEEISARSAHSTSGKDEVSNGSQGTEVAKNITNNGEYKIVNGYEAKINPGKQDKHIP
jgi:hypothetical protein